MKTEELLELNRDQPFQPFRLVVADGRIYDVRHPELFLIGSSTCYLGVAAKSEDYLIADHFVRIATSHIPTAIPLSVAEQLS